ncbi:triose-phosphate isomerase [Luminiphilus syltensis NOR5-1B]|uniref:Triosephosphate isomerase n=1 Tax=Luminiphilus syltensis NOR5-1B TaxID=565045 RepID=B8KS04_9GAMM|nr:triose-phosphate isomerase [Luminiphilus syltensis]EED34566.1 triose-phosphate isomerase [Luminiphilus syltensis NOR5-1B]
MADKLVIGNWKLFGSNERIREFAIELKALSAGRLDAQQVVICTPYPYLATLAAVLPEVGVGAQDCSVNTEGAFTGEVSAAMLADVGCRWSIVGHSERRQYHAESDAGVALKAVAVQQQGLCAVVCVGESLEERKRGDHIQRVASQVRASLEGVAAENLVVAYEPIWAIGTGETATPEQADEMHGVIRQVLVELYGESGRALRVLYGGSVKPSTAGGLFACDNIDGALVGGASLEAESFWQIVTAA